MTTATIVDISTVYDELGNVLYKIEVEVSEDDLHFLLQPLFIEEHLITNEELLQYKIEQAALAALPYFKYIGRSYNIRKAKPNLEGYKYTEAEHTRT